MHGRDESVRAIMHHAHGRALGEVLGCGVEVAEHSVAQPSAHQVDGVRVDLREKERHRPAHLKVSCADVCLGESDFGAGGVDYGLDGGGYLVAEDDVLDPLEIDFRKGGVDGGVVLA